MAKGRKEKRPGARTGHVWGRLKKQYGFKGEEKEANRFIHICRKKAGRNGWIIISAENLGVSAKQMRQWGIPDDKYFIGFTHGKAPTILQLKVKVYGEG